MTVSELSLVTTVPDRIEDLEDVKRWIAARDARDEERWKSQAAQDKRLDMFAHRLSAVERRVMWISGVCAAAGAALGVLGGSLVGAS